VKKALIAVVGLGFAAISLAQLSKHEDWGKSAEAYFLTPSEKDAWSRVATDADAEKFIAEYWARRDPNPATSANEFRDEINRRIAAADEQFKMRNKRGSETSRGRLLVTLGLPTRVSSQRAGAEPGIRDERFPHLLEARAVRPLLAATPCEQGDGTRAQRGRCDDDAV